MKHPALTKQNSFTDLPKARGDRALPLSFLPLPSVTMPADRGISCGENQEVKRNQRLEWLLIWQRGMWIFHSVEISLVALSLVVFSTIFHGTPVFLGRRAHAFM